MHSIPQSGVNCAKHTSCRWGKLTGERFVAYSTESETGGFRQLGSRFENERVFRLASVETSGVGAVTRIGDLHDTHQDPSAARPTGGHQDPSPATGGQHRNQASMASLVRNSV